MVEGCRKLAWNNPKWITVAMRSGATGLVWGKLDKTTDSKTVSHKKLPNENLHITYSMAAAQNGG